MQNSLWVQELVVLNYLVKFLFFSQRSKQIGLTYSKADGIGDTTPITLIPWVRWMVVMAALPILLYAVKGYMQLTQAYSKQTKWTKKFNSPKLPVTPSLPGMSTLMLSSLQLRLDKFKTGLPPNGGTLIYKSWSGGTLSIQCRWRWAPRHVWEPLWFSVPPTSEPREQWEWKL